MPKTPRVIDPNGGTYHVRCRGNNGSVVFNDREDYLRLRSIILITKNKFPFDIYHYSLMTNHIHLDVGPRSGDALPKIMKRINHCYSLYRKKKYGFIGQLWQGPYKSRIIRDDSYLLTCGIYIELNPVRAGMVSEPDQYEWSSYKTYAYGQPDELITISPAYLALGNTDSERQRTYRALAKMWRNTRNEPPAI